MTLSTDFLIFDPVDPEEVYAKCLRLLGVESALAKRAEGEIANAPGQGFDAWLVVYYGELGHDRWCQDPDEPPCDRQQHQPHRVRVNWDTAYGYRSELGGCTELHAMYILDLGQWCDERGLRWAWVNEYTGKMHHGRNGVSEFLQSGDDAMSWFTNVVVPYIEERGGTIER